MFGMKEAMCAFRTSCCRWPPPMVLLSPIKTWPQYYCICRRRRFRGGGQMKWDTCQREGTKVTFLRPFNYCIATLGYNHLLRTVSIFAFPQAMLFKMMMVGMKWIGHYATPLIGKPHIFQKKKVDILCNKPWSESGHGVVPFCRQ